MSQPQEYSVVFKDGSSLPVTATGATNAWYICRNFWPDKEIELIKPLSDSLDEALEDSELEKMVAKAT